MAKGMEKCQLSKILRHTVTPVHTFLEAFRSFDDIHIHLVVQLRNSRGQRYILTCVSRYTRLVDSYPASDIWAKWLQWPYTQQDFLFRLCVDHQDSGRTSV